MIAEKTIKYTRQNKVMAFLTLEDMTGSVEVIVFPKSYEDQGALLQEDRKVFIQGRVQAEEDKDGKLICEKIIPFEDVPRKLWIRFPDRASYEAGAKELFELIDRNGGRDKVILYLEDVHQRRVLPPGQGVRADRDLVDRLGRIFGSANVILQ